MEAAVASSQRLTRLWVEEGFRALLQAIVEEDPDWPSVQLEATRRVRTDPEFARLVETGVGPRRTRKKREDV